ncbi:hypothetical protein RRG08_030440 [Elysia crispata]|uniref:Uncharacterized protein n=1 Tax=Elysia crispata TaxID=231223 RepID=A0AAE1B008_9GAST|nr:hypothetical protein RRG08_030440 [Elysia crispata]
MSKTEAKNEESATVSEQLQSITELSKSFDERLRFVESTNIQSSAQTAQSPTTFTAEAGSAIPRSLRPFPIDQLPDARLDFPISIKGTDLTTTGEGGSSKIESTFPDNPTTAVGTTTTAVEVSVVLARLTEIDKPAQEMCG